MGLFDSIKNLSSSVQSIVKSGSNTYKTAKSTVLDAVTTGGNFARNAGYYLQNAGNVVSNVGSGVREAGNNINGAATVLGDDQLMALAKMIGDQTSANYNGNVRPTGNSDGMDWFVIAAWGVGAVAAYALLKKM